MAMIINRVILSMTILVIFGVGMTSEKRISPSQTSEETSLTTYIEFTDGEAGDGATTFDDREIENSLLVVFQHQMIDGSGTWVCKELVFSDDLNRSCRLAVSTPTGLVRLFAIANANNNEDIRNMLSSHQLDYKKLPTLDMVEKALFKVNPMNRNDRPVRMKDTTLLLTNQDEGRSVSIGLNRLAAR